MTTDAPTRSRHIWTKEELAHLNRSVAHSKTKSAAFKRIAEEMGMNPKSVAQIYYSHHRSPKKSADTGSAGASKVNVKQEQKQWTDPIQQGRPFDFTSYSERELSELSQALNFEVNRRIEALRELESFFAKA